MDATITIDRSIIDEAMSFENFSNPVDAVRLALEEFIQNRKKRNLVKMFGTVDFDPAYNYKAARA